LPRRVPDAVRHEAQRNAAPLILDRSRLRRSRIGSAPLRASHSALHCVRDTIGDAVPTFMDKALDEARAAQAAGEVPVGCVIVRDGAVIAAAGNRTLADRDPTAHAEMLAIRAAARALGSERLADCDLYVTLEPCAMCAAAISFARIRRLYYGAADPKGGAVEHGVRLFASPTCHHRPQVYGGIGETAAADLLRSFFQVRRD
jgi:tRNA(adenine34) deaminase